MTASTAPTESASSGGPDPARMVQVIARRDDAGRWFGSGYRVAGELVLTAAHVVADAREVTVRFVVEPDRILDVGAQVAWSDAVEDVAVLRIDTAGLDTAGLDTAGGYGGLPGEQVGPVAFGRITAQVRCEALGFPRFKLRDAREAGSEGGGDAGAAARFRDSHHAIGTAVPWSNAREGTLEINVAPPEYDADPRHSPWEGMSGAAVWARNCLVGVIGKHHRGDGLGRLAASRVENWYEGLAGSRIEELSTLIGLPGTPGGLREVALAGRPLVVGQLRQLPTTTLAFTGRTSELGRLAGFADRLSDRDPSDAVAVAAIDGMAGIGKTALAVHAAHHIAARFPDGQLFLDLRGFADGVAPLRPADALATLLQAFGVPPQQIPKDLDARAGLYRDCLADLRVLILLDNAASEAQVRPLLPGAGRCLVLVTSRKRLKGLDDAFVLSLDVLSRSAAVELFERVAGADRASADDPLVGQIAEMCGYLPLALRIAAALFRNRSAWNLAFLAAKLRGRKPGLAGFSDGERSLAAVFDLSYQNLSADQQRLFLHLGLIPGPDIDRYAAAALFDTGTAEAEDLLQDLVDHSLLSEPVPGRYQMHDLIRTHARAQALRGPATGSEAALERLSDFYQHTAARAEALIAQFTRPGPPDRSVLRAPDLPNPEAARMWLRTERADILACVDYAAAQAQDERVVALVAGMATLLLADGPWPVASQLLTTAVAAAERVGDRRSQADLLTRLGSLRRVTGDSAGAIGDLEQARDMYLSLGDSLGQANALIQSGMARRATGGFRAATEEFGQALGIYRELGDRLGEANALSESGSLLRMTGDGAQAAHDLGQALSLYRSLGRPHGQANARTGLGTLRRASGDYPGAIRELEAARKLYHDLDDRLGEANVLSELGNARRLTGGYGEAIEALERALDLCRGLGHRIGQAYVLATLADIRALTGDHAQGAEDAQRSFDLFRGLDNRLGQGIALTILGSVRRRAGDLGQAARDLEQALAYFREIDSPANRAWALNQYAVVVRAAGEAPRAVQLHREALGLATQTHSPDEQASALEGIGRCLVLEGDTEGGGTHLNQALEIFQRIGMLPDAERVEAELADLDVPRPSPRPAPDPDQPSP